MLTLTDLLVFGERCKILESSLSVVFVSEEGELHSGHAF